MLWRTLKHWMRRRQLARRGVRPECRLPLLGAGDRSGVWTICPEGMHAERIIYSLGVGNNVAWDLEMIERFGVAIHAFDPTPASVSWVRAQHLPDRFHFHALGVAARDGTARFALRSEGKRFNYRSGAALGAGSIMVEAPVARLGTLMERNGHDRIDVLKMDIEGSEYEVLADLLAHRIAVGQLLVEFHHTLPGVGLSRTLHAVGSLRDAGYRLFHVSPRGLEMSFIHEANWHRPLERQATPPSHHISTAK
jgi:FkbM family methyltransferase